MPFYGLVCSFSYLYLCIRINDNKKSNSTSRLWKGAKN